VLLFSDKFGEFRDHESRGEEPSGKGGGVTGPSCCIRYSSFGATLLLLPTLFRDGNGKRGDGRWPVLSATFPSS
jgi:hypothetical protein